MVFQKEFSTVEMMVVLWVKLVGRKVDKMAASKDGSWVLNLVEKMADLMVARTAESLVAKKAVATVDWKAALMVAKKDVNWVDRTVDL